MRQKERNSMRVQPRSVASAVTIRALFAVAYYSTVSLSLISNVNGFICSSSLSNRIHYVYGRRSSSCIRMDENNSDEILSDRIAEQQRQIDQLMNLVTQQQQQQVSASLPNNENNNNYEPSSSESKKKKAMLFIDGTWLYYSIHERQNRKDPITQKFGRGWQIQYQVDWSAIPKIISEQLSKTNTRLLSSSQEQQEIEIVRASVFTSYKKTTDKNSLRAKMFDELQKAGYDVHLMETMGSGEKCVDIQLAVEMLHYATVVPSAYDIAILLSGDKDFMPALKRTRQKGKQTAIVSMRSGCNRALYEDEIHLNNSDRTISTSINTRTTTGEQRVKDYNIVWLEDYLDQIIIPKNHHNNQNQNSNNHITAGSNDGAASATATNNIMSKPTISAKTMTKLIHYFISHYIRQQQQKEQNDETNIANGVSSRDIGRYLQQVKLGDGYTNMNMLEQLKNEFGGLRHFLSIQDDIFQVTTEVRKRGSYKDPNDRSFWVNILQDDLVKYYDDMNNNMRQTNYYSQQDQNQATPHGEIYQPITADDPSFYQFTLEAQQRTNNHHNGQNRNNIPSYSTFQQQTEKQVDDYSSYTLEKLKDYCRLHKLPVSGRKTDVYQRVIDHSTSIQSKENYNDSNSHKSNNNDYFIPDEKTSIVIQHLDSLIQEYIHACGGQAGSRDLGRYLTANSSSSTSSSALEELKENFGTLKNYVSRVRSDIFYVDVQNNLNGGDREYGFPIRLRPEENNEYSRGNNTNRRKVGEARIKR